MIATPLVLSTVVLLALAQAPTQPASAADDLKQAEAAVAKSDNAGAIRLLEALTAREIPRAERARALQLLAQSQANVGRFDEALATADRAERLARELDDSRLLALIECVRGYVWRVRGAGLQAVTHFKRGLAWAERAGDPALVASSNAFLGSAYLSLGDWSRVLDYTERAFAAESNHSAIARYRYFIQRGVAYYELHDRDRAERDFRSALETARQAGNPRAECSSLGELGLVSWEFDRNRDRALEYYEQALSLARAGPIPVLEITWLNNSANVFRDTGEWNEALRRYRLALARDGEMGGGDRAMLLKNIGQVLARQGEHAEAERHLLEARTEADRKGQAKFRWESRLELGQLYASRDPALAERSFAESIDLLEAHHSNVVLETFRAGALSRSLTAYDPYDLYIQFLLNRGDTARAFHVAERARARAFLDTLSLAREEIGAAIPLDYVRAENALLHEISAQQASLRGQPQDGAGLAQSRSAIEALESKLTALRLRLATEQPAVAHVRYPRLVSAEALQQDVLGRDETLLLFYVGRAGSAAWVVRPDALEVVRLPPRETIERAVRPYLESIATPGAPADPVAARALAAMLVPGLDAHVPDGSRFIVVPHGILHHVPFEALADATGRYVIEKFIVSYAPSVSSLAYLRHPPTARPRGREVVAVGKFVARPAAPADERDFQMDWIRDLRPLPHTGAELRQIASIFGRRARVLEQHDANEDALARSLENAGALHFATHALVDEEQPDRSGLALTPHADSDGILQMREIYRMRVPASLVTLSACRTALGRRLTGEGVIGLSRAFFYAGADTVVASLWNVNDAAAAQWMGTFYEAVRDGMPIDEAVRNAKLRFLRSDSRLRHPYYWAGFVATGHAATRLDIGGPQTAVVVAAAVGTASILILAALAFRARAARRRTVAAATGWSARRAC